ncbi:MAG: chromosome segregation protein SMC [Desulfobulbus propionicus]|nr:MAG: chromosome segregation protein SMC [Desulfobulbus propionicus]
MKILELRWKNLNSLYGEWGIDFTDPEYVAGGIFALTGPTGAGKSTILDAICLALYGATPRLGKITKNGNEIMSRQTGECYAEVVFASQAGQFRCHWEQRRARKKPDGNLQDQEHQIIDDTTGKPIETKKSRVTGIVEEKTGMDFDRFTRSILLAQGGFDTFLKADAEQKSKILEQLTGTEIYSEISRRVHERQREEKEKLNILNAETSGIVILEPEQVGELREELRVKLQQEAALAAALTETGKAIAWLTTIEGIKQEICRLGDEAKQLKADIEAFTPQRGRLEQAMKAASLDGTYATLTALRQQQTDDLAALQTAATALPELETAAHTATEALQAAEQLTLQAKQDLKAAAPLIQKIRFLDQKIGDQAKVVSAGDETCTREGATIEKGQQALAKELEKGIAARKRLEAAALYLKAHAKDQWLVSGLTGIEEQFGNLVARQREIAHKKIDLKNADTAVAAAAKKLEAAMRQCTLRKQELAAASQHLQEGKEALDELLGEKFLREYRTEKENLLRELAFRKKIEALEDHRTRLEDGKPCPLCGSLIHPFAAANVPVPGKIEEKIEALTRLITRAEAQEAAIKKLELAETTAGNRLNDSDKLETAAANDKRAAEKTLVEIKDVLLRLESDVDELRLAVAAKLEPLGYAVDVGQPEATLGKLRSNMEKWQEQAKQKNDTQEQITAIDSEVKRLEAVLETQVRTLTEKQENLEQLKKRLADETAERKSLYGDNQPDDEENRLNAAIAEAENTEKKARKHNTELQQQLTTAKAHVVSLKKRSEQRAPALKKAETAWLAALRRAGFVEEKAFIRARLATDKLEVLASRARELDAAQTDVKAREKDRQARLAMEVAKKLTNKTLEQLELQVNEYEEALKVRREAIAGLKHRLHENTVAQARIREKQSAILAQKKEWQRWDKLHAHIGSADGKKYRTFAQGLTFELMVTHANRQLEKMTDRYLLLRDEQQPLELNVIDTYQAGEIRSTRNLSGGESFIVSLTLALGLSKMASRNVRVDSLFLDEGFGTLDEEALEASLETLAGLQQHGKLIGIISHVSALKERIRTQIHITPGSGGRSSLSGPGCTKIGEQANS